MVILLSFAVGITGLAFLAPVFGDWWGTRRVKRIEAAIDRGDIPPYRVDAAGNVVPCVG